MTSLDIDRSGNRLVSGCFDGTIKIWDFSGLTRKPEAFQTVDAGDGYPVQATCWAPTGGFFLACTGDCQGKVYDRDGNFEIECLKGDNYLHDISNTKRHTYPFTDGTLWIGIYLLLPLGAKLSDLGYLLQALWN